MKSDLDALEVNAYPFLVLVGYAASAQRDAQSGMIDRFQKARPESLVNGDGGLDDPVQSGSNSWPMGVPPDRSRKHESTKARRNQEPGLYLVLAVRGERQTPLFGNGPSLSSTGVTLGAILCAQTPFPRRSRPNPPCQGWPGGWTGHHQSQGCERGPEGGLVKSWDCRFAVVGSLVSVFVAPASHPLRARGPRRAQGIEMDVSVG